MACGRRLFGWLFFSLLGQFLVTPLSLFSLSPMATGLQASSAAAAAGTPMVARAGTGVVRLPVTAARIAAEAAAAGNYVCSHAGREEGGGASISERMPGDDVAAGREWRQALAQHLSNVCGWHSEQRLVGVAAVQRLE